MSALDALKDAWLRGEEADPRLVVQTISSLAELSEYRAGLCGRSAMTTDAMAAIRDRELILTKRERK